MSKIYQVNNRREFLKSGVTAAAALGCLGLGLQAQPLVINRPLEDDPNQHNMMVIGVKTVYLSHLPMFDGVNPDDKTEFASPHRRQVILEATFTDGNRDLTQIYTNDRLKNPGVKMYTLRPADFVLGLVDPNGSALKTFRGKGVFRGHLERPGHRAIIGVAGDDPPEGMFDVN